MSEISLTEKLSESIVATFKKTEVFEKLRNFEFYLTSFFTISSIVGLTCACFNYINYTKHQYNTELIKENENMIKLIIDNNRKRNLIEHCKLKSEILILGNQLSEIYENQKIIINKLDELKLLKNIDDVKSVTHTENMSFSPIKVPSLVIECKLDINEDDYDEDYDELSHECYDSIPLNNIKKNTNLSWLFT